MKEEKKQETSIEKTKKWISPEITEVDIKTQTNGAGMAGGDMGMQAFS